jgi:hypothetical protein
MGDSAGFLKGNRVVSGIKEKGGEVGIRGKYC